MRGRSRGEHERSKKTPRQRGRHEKIADPVAGADHTEPGEARDQVAATRRRRVARVPPEKQEGSEDANGLKVPIAGEPHRDRHDDVCGGCDSAKRRAPALLGDPVEQRGNGRAHEDCREIDQEIVVAEQKKGDRLRVILPIRVMAHQRRARRANARVPRPRRVRDPPADDLLGGHHRTGAAGAEVAAAGNAEDSPCSREDEPGGGKGENRARHAIEHGAASPHRSDEATRRQAILAARLLQSGSLVARGSAAAEAGATSKRRMNALSSDRRCAISGVRAILS
jgi:hypothetical protein